MPTRFHNRNTAPKIIYGATSLASVGSGAVTLQIKPGQAAKRLTRKGARLTVVLVVTFTPTGGTANSKTIRVAIPGSGKRGHC